MESLSAPVLCVLGRLPRRTVACRSSSSSTPVGSSLMDEWKRRPWLGTDCDRREVSGPGRPREDPPDDARVSSNLGSYEPPLMNPNMVALSDDDKAASLAARRRTPAAVPVAAAAAETEELVVVVVPSSDIGDRNPLDVVLAVPSAILVRAAPPKTPLEKERSAKLAGIDDE